MFILPAGRKLSMADPRPPDGLTCPGFAMHRRRFLSRSALALGGAAAGLESRAAPGEDYALVPPEAYAPVTDDVTTAVKAGLGYLARTQNKDGSFGEFGAVSGNVAVTSLAALAFMAGGHQPGRGEFGANVGRALKYVLSCEQPKPAGYFHVPRGAFQQTGMYSHGFGTLLLAECYGMAPDAALQPKLKGAVERAVQLIVSTQNSEGGWRVSAEARVGRRVGHDLPDHGPPGGPQRRLLRPQGSRGQVRQVRPVVSGQGRRLQLLQRPGAEPASPGRRPASSPSTAPASIRAPRSTRGWTT